MISLEETVIRGSEFQGSSTVWGSSQPTDITKLRMQSSDITGPKGGHLHLLPGTYFHQLKTTPIVMLTFIGRTNACISSPSRTKWQVETIYHLTVGVCVCVCVCIHTFVYTQIYLYIWVIFILTKINQKLFCYCWIFSVWNSVRHKVVPPQIMAEQMNKSKELLCVNQSRNKWIKSHS